MKTPIEFDYDLWTTEEGKCMVRIKLTGEVTEVDREVMKILRAEEKRMRRDYAKNLDEGGKPILSLDDVSENEVGNSAWLADHMDLESSIVTGIMERTFRETLTDNQRSIYDECILGGKSYVDYGKEHGVCYQYVQKSIQRIRKKAQKYFSR